MKSKDNIFYLYCSITCEVKEVIFYYNLCRDRSEFFQHVTPFTFDNYNIN